MGVSATFYQTGKKLNSTAIPSAIAGDFGVTVELKAVTDLYTPTLIISADQFTDGLGNITNPMKFVYCYIAEFQRYYFIRSWSWILGRWECALEIDVLASFKSEIGETTAYVLRAYSEADPDVVDTKYPVKGADAASVYQYKTYSSVYNIWNTDLYNNTVSDGYFRVAIVNDDGSAIGSVSHYAMSGQTMREMMNVLYSSPSWMNITDTSISNDLAKMMTNPMQYIVSILWIPTGFNTAGHTAIHTLPYGWWSFSLSGDVYKISTSDMEAIVQTSIPVYHHPQYSSKKHWLQLSPYTTAALYLTPFGFIPLDTSKIYNATHVDIEVRIDVITGKGTLILSSHKTVDGVTTYGGVFYTTTSQVGVPMTIAQMSVDMSALGQASTWVGAAGMALAAGGLQDGLKDLKNGLIDGIRDVFASDTGKNVAGALAPVAGAVNAIQQSSLQGALGNIVSRIQQAATSQTGEGVGSTSPGESLLSTLKGIAADVGSAALAAAGTCQSSGASGGFAALSELLYIQWYFQKLVDDDPVHYGYPLCATRKINTLSGFILCQNADSLQVDCTPAERQAICAFMEAGFYYE